MNSGMMPSVMGSTQMPANISRQSPTGFHQDLQDYRQSPGVLSREVKVNAQQESTLQNQLASPQIAEAKSLGNAAQEIVPNPAETVLPRTKLVAVTDEGSNKKKRGRPKKLILDPATNLYIDSSHENYKRLNKLLKESSTSPKTSPIDPQMGKLVTRGTNFGSLNDVAVKQLLEQKDRRGRPRKFPIEQTGITIKGIRVNGILKSRKKTPVATGDDQAPKRKRGRPKREQPVLP